MATHCSSARAAAASVIGAVLALAAGCTPDIAAGTYYCGPERLCPPHLACDEPTYTCESPLTAEPFRCPDSSEEFEPDDDLASAREVGVGCGAGVFDSQNGCLVSDDTTDLFKLTLGYPCAGDDPHVVAILSYPVALRSLQLEVLDDGGQVIATSAYCSPTTDTSGTDRQCLEFSPLEPIYYLRVKAEPGAPNCGGACRHNQYWLSISYPLS